MSLHLSKQDIKSFHQTVYQSIRRHRRTFPWRRTKDPYRILVSEIMLQQTQADRVVKKYNSFIKKFPNVSALARAPLGTVLRYWQGLGYNRRALQLKQASQEITQKFRGKVPKKAEILRQLSGIGPYTAAAILAFAFDQPVEMIETNIRAVYIYYFFRGKKKVRDEQLLPLIRQTIDYRSPRQWYNALMDYGAMLKKQYPNPTRQSHHYVRQKKFFGSNRQLRGMVMKSLSKNRQLSLEQLALITVSSSAKIKRALDQLCQEGLIERHRATYRLPK